MAEIILKIIKEIEAKKRADNRLPNYALLFDVIQAAKTHNGINPDQTRQSLNELHQSGQIETGDTINDKYIISK